MHRLQSGDPPAPVPESIPGLLDPALLHPQPGLLQQPHVQPHGPRLGEVHRVLGGAARGQVHHDLPQRTYLLQILRGWLYREFICLCDSYY